MKNKKMKRGLLLASCAMFLTGCNPDALWGLGGYWNQFAGGVGDFFNNIAVKLGLKEAEKKEEKKEDQKPEPQPEPTKEVSVSLKDMPELLFIGEELDLDEHVVVENSEAAFTVELAASSAEVASLEGHKISVLDEGEVNFTVSVEGKSANGKFATLSEQRYIMMSELSDFGVNYSVFMLDETYSIDGYMERNENYFVTDMWDYDEATQTLYAGGIVKFGEDVDEAYPFTLSFDETTGADSVEVSNQIYPSYYLDVYYNPEFKFDFSGLKRVVESYEKDGESYESEYFTLVGDDAIDFCDTYFLQDGGTYYIDEEKTQTDEFKYERVDFSVVDMSETEVPEYALLTEIYIDYYPEAEVEGEPNYELAAVNVIAAQEEPLFDSLGAIAGKPECAPEGTDLAALIGLPDFFESLEEAAKDPSVGACSVVSYGWKYNGSPITMTDSLWGQLGLGNSIFTLFPQGGMYESFDSNMILDFDSDFNVIQGVCSNTVNEVTTIYDVEYDADEQEYAVWSRSDIEDIYASELYHYGDLAKEETWAKDLFYGVAQVPGTATDPDTGEEYQYLAGFMLYANMFRNEMLLDKLFELNDDLGYLKNVLVYYEALDLMDASVFVGLDDNYDISSFELMTSMDYIKSVMGVNLVYEIDLLIVPGNQLSSSSSEVYSQLDFGD